MRYLFSIILFFSSLYSFESEDKLINYLHKKFTNFYPTIQINNIKISPKSTIPKDFVLNRVYFMKNSIKRNRGNFSAVYSKDNREKRVYFSYNIDAKVKVYVTIMPLRSHTVLEEDFFDTTSIKFENFYDIPVINLRGLELKVSIPRGKILTQRMVRKIPDIHRGDILTAEARDFGVTVYINVKALEDGSKGEMIRVKRENSSKILQAKIISSNRVLIK